MRWPLEQIRPMQFTLGNFVYLGLCLEAFFFGTICTPELSVPLLKHFNITPSQDSILAYSPCIYSTIYGRKTPTRPSRKLFFSILYVLCTFYLLLPFPWIQQQLWSCSFEEQ